MSQQLPILRNQTAKAPSKTRWNQWSVLSVRLLLIAFMLFAFNSAANRESLQPTSAGALSLEQIQQVEPRASKLGPEVTVNEFAGTRLLDENQQTIGLAITTSPMCDQIMGYSGPNNVLILLDEQQRVTAVRLLNSGDTVEHAEKVERADNFWAQFVGRQVVERAGEVQPDVDAVSGATLTSLAIAEAIELRLTGSRQSLRFPNEVTLEEAQQLDGRIAKIAAAAWQTTSIYDSNDQQLGWIFRTGPRVDDVEGYQGPTEVLLLFENDAILKQVRLRKSYDNEPYVGYVKQEYGFWAKFKGRSFDDLAKLDIEEEEIEGVSGATMTSLAVAQTIQKAIERLTIEKQSESIAPTRPWFKSVNWSINELLTLLVVLLAIPFSRSRWRRNGWARIAWQVATFIVLGLVTGNLLSLGLFAGWTRGGFPIHLAPGLAILLTVSLLWPAFSKQNIYCDHLCPHGSLQQWLARTSKSQTRKLPRWLEWSLKLTPMLALVAAVVWLLWEWPIRLSWLEPFDAYAWRVGFSVSAFVWIIGLMFAWYKPMSYCRLACPTGKLISYFRRSRTASLGMIDLALLLLGVAALWLV